MIDTLIDLFRHMEWADAAVWRSVLSCEAACADGKTRELLSHIHHVQYAFRRVWRGEPREAPYPEFDTVQPLAVYAREFHPEATEFLERQTDVTAGSETVVPWASMVEKRIGRPAQPTTLGETALQVALHSQYHRGQVNARLRLLGGEPPLVDYIVWVWLGRPPADWPDEQA